MKLTAKEYHLRTSYDRRLMSGHVLDWASQPKVFKTYPGLKTVPLPPVTEWGKAPLSQVLQEPIPARPETEIDRERLARILRLAEALTAKSRIGGADFYFRSVASAGALYPFELYVGTSNVPELEDALYHYTLSLDALTVLRQGNILADLAQGIDLDMTAPPVLVFFLTSIFFRSSWKYRERSYRYDLLDTGHLAEGLALALKESGTPFRLQYDFDDRKVNELLGLDEIREVCLAVAFAFGNNSPSSADALHLGEPAEGLSASSRVAAREIDHPTVREIHAASSALTPSAPSLPDMMDNLVPERGEARTIAPPARWPEEMSYVEAVSRRRSMRNFMSRELDADRFAALVRMLCAGPTDAANAQPLAGTTIAVGILVGNVEGVDPGFYLIDPELCAIHLVRGSSLTGEMARVCLEQEWLRNSAVEFLFLSNLGLLDRVWGPRGYRHALLSAGRLGQRIYLAATSMRLGCCGIGAYYDNEAAALLRLTEEARLLYLVAVGPVRKWTGA
ncbi:MAG: SagB/ThcOx family dehydrogenase [Desulfomonile tiedjei]|nr:SagB/ThcOx family dehydrogenase [Desulfomonile tiedjei]